MNKDKIIDISPGKVVDIKEGDAIRFKTSSGDTIYYNVQYFDELCHIIVCTYNGKSKQFIKNWWDAMLDIIGLSDKNTQKSDIISTYNLPSTFRYTFTTIKSDDFCLENRKIHGMFPTKLDLYTKNVIFTYDFIDKE